MKFINKSKKSIEIRAGEKFNYSWITVKSGETIDLPRKKGKRYGFEKVIDSGQELPKVTKGKIGKKKVETKQIETDKQTDKITDNYTPDDDFYNELIAIKGIGWKTAEDIVHWGTKEKLIEQIKLKMHLPFRDDVVKKLKRKYGK